MTDETTADPGHATSPTPSTTDTHPATGTRTGSAGPIAGADGSAKDSAGSSGTDTAMPDWEKRFRAPRIGLPDWAEDAPDRSLFVSNATGTFELYAWDRATGSQRQATDRPNGTTDGTLSPDGRWIWWFSDTDGDEFGVWMRQPFEGGADEPATPGLAASYPGGLAIGRDGTAVVGCSTDEEGSTVHVVRPGEPPVEIYRHRESAGVGDLSHDGSLIALEHTEHGDAMHSAIRVVRPDGSTVAELDDTNGGTEELGLSVMGFAPVDGDARLLVGHQRRGRWEPMLWDPLTGTETALGIDLPGDVGADWYPDGSALLVEHEYQARSELWRYELGAPGGATAGGTDAAAADGRPLLTRVETPAGTVSGATARPDGAVEFLWSSAAQPPEVRSTSGKVVLDPPGMKAPGSVPVRDVWVEGPGGRIHALVQQPAGEGPSRRSSTYTAVRPGTTVTPSPRRPRPGWTTASRSYASTTAARPATAVPGRMRSSTASG